MRWYVAYWLGREWMWEGFFLRPVEDDGTRISIAVLGDLGKSFREGLANIPVLEENMHTIGIYSKRKITLGEDSYNASGCDRGAG